MEHLIACMADLPFYEQEGGPHISYQFVVKPGTMGLTSVGRIRAKGPTATAPNCHSGWDQLYLILSGTGTITLDGQEHKVSSGTVVRIPRNTRHGVILGPKEELEYVYINAFENQQALDALLKTL